MEPAPVDAERDAHDELEMVVKKYTRGNPVNVKGLTDKKLRGNLTVKENLYGQSAKAAAKADKWLKPTEDGGLEPEGLEKTYRFQQTDILKEAPLSSSRKAFDMNLPVLGPYTPEYTPNGRYMLVGGRKGHLALMDMLHMDLIKEFNHFP